MTDSIISIRVRQIILETHDVKTFVFERPDGGSITYKAGQFLTFLLMVDGREVRRSYSMSSAPAVDDFPAITVKRVPNGEVSRLWVDRVVVGDLFTILEPAGRFTLDDEGAQREVIMVGAGSGITPLFSIMKETLSVDKGTHVTLLYANRSEKTVIFNQELHQWQLLFPGRLRVIHIFSDPSDEWKGLRGRLNNARLEAIIGASTGLNLASARIFICGPYEFMRSIEITFHYLGITKGQIRKENFVIETIPEPPRQSLPHYIKLIVKGTHYALFVPAHTTILDAALMAGIHLPYSCRGGRCATCACVCSSGSVYMSINEVLTDKDLAEGWILSCSAYPDDDNVTIELK